MEKLVKKLGIIALVVLIGVLMAACLDEQDGEETGSGATLKINGLPGNGNFTVYVLNSVTNTSNFSGITNALDSNTYIALGVFSSGNVFNMFAWNGTAQAGKWTGSGSLPVLLVNSNGSITDTNNPMYRHATVNFSNGSAEVHFNIFMAVVQGVDNVLLTNIAVTNMPVKTLYSTGETLAINGLVITAFYSDGSSKPVTGYITNPVNGAVLNNSGTNTISVSYTEGGVTMDTHFNVAVNDSQDQSTATINLTVGQIIDGTPLSFGSIRISRSGVDFPVTETILVNASDFDPGSIRWEIIGIGYFAGEIIPGSGSQFTLNANDIRYNSLGGHTLTLTVRKNGLQYQREIPFIIMQ
jgi:hypothetical protein